KERVATLRGKVHTDAERNRAARLAHVNGVRRVVNDIALEGAATKGTAGTLAEKTKDTAKTAAEGTKAGGQKVTEKAKPGLSKTGEVITDTWITGRVKSGFLGEDLLKGSDID